MKHFFQKHVPLIVGVLFLYSGGYKLIYPGQATAALLTLGALAWQAHAVVAGVTVLELYLGSLLVLKTDLPVALFGSMATLCAFTVFLWYLSRLVSPPACGCMGLSAVFESNKHNALLGMFRNCVILWGLKVSYNYYADAAAGTVSAGPQAKAREAAHA